MNWIKPPLHPQRFPDELPYGYLKRLAELNRYENPGWLFRHLSSPSRLQDSAFLDMQLPTSARAGSKSKLSSVGRNLVNRHHLRYCPLCIAEGGYWKSSWQCWVSCACTKHQLWLVDRCHHCHSELPLQSTKLERCSCGADLSNTIKETIDAPVEHMQVFLDEGRVPTGNSILPEKHGLDYASRASLISFMCSWLDHPKLTPQRFNSELKRCSTARLHFANAADILFEHDGLENFLFRLAQSDSPKYYSSRILKFVLWLNISFPQSCFRPLKHDALSYWVQLRSALDREQGRESDIADLWDYAQWQVLPHDPK